MQRDGQRGRVYAAEDVWRAQLDAARAGARELAVAGSRVVLPLEVHFGDLDAVRAWLSRLEAEGGWPAAPLSVRARRGVARAHYEPPARIALPGPERPWALREAVVLHEVAHHLAGPPLDHGPHFAAAMLRVVGVALGPEAVLALQVRYAAADVSVDWARVRA